ncbi:hypothetical protein [Yoonia sp.]|uniref:hypothetical protein n=1 Tax=Yoonia sp. TaxID=2212373 RepID=UPI0025E6DE2C|nr:hypothetical protein [Yoonia sp.]
MQLPLTLRIAFHGLRSLWLAVFITLAGWIAFVPATADERSALGARIGDARPPGLVPLRTARAMVRLAPDRAARLLSRASNGELSPELAAMLLRDIAKGQHLQPPPGPSDPVGGAKFIQVR